MTLGYLWILFYKYLWARPNQLCISMASWHDSRLTGLSVITSHSLWWYIALLTRSRAIQELPSHYYKWQQKTHLSQFVPHASWEYTRTRCDVDASTSTLTSFSMSSSSTSVLHTIVAFLLLPVMSPTSCKSVIYILNSIIFIIYIS